MTELAYSLRPGRRFHLQDFDPGYSAGIDKKKHGIKLLEERLEREEYEDRIDKFKGEIEAEIRRRLVADRGAEAMAKTHAHRLGAQALDIGTGLGDALLPRLVRDALGAHDGARRSGTCDGRRPAPQPRAAAAPSAGRSASSASSPSTAPSRLGRCRSCPPSPAR